MKDKLEDLLYQSGLTAQGCWDELDDYARQGIEKFAELIVRECANVELYWLSMADRTGVVEKIYQHFGVEE